MATGKLDAVGFDSGITKGGMAELPQICSELLPLRRPTTDHVEIREHTHCNDSVPGRVYNTDTGIDFGTRRKASS